VEKKEKRKERNIGRKMIRKAYERIYSKRETKHSGIKIAIYKPNLPSIIDLSCLGNLTPNYLVNKPIYRHLTRVKREFPK